MKLILQRKFGLLYGKMRAIENEYMAFKHLNMVKNFEVLPSDAATQEWIGAMETYRLTTDGKITVLEVSVDTVEKYIDFFNTVFVKALVYLKNFQKNNKQYLKLEL